MRGSEARLLAGDEALIVHLYAAVARIGVGNHLPGVARSPAAANYHGPDVLLCHMRFAVEIF